MGLLGISLSRDKEAGRLNRPPAKAQQVRLTRDVMKHLVQKTGVQEHPHGRRAMNPSDCLA